MDMDILYAEGNDDNRGELDTHADTGVGGRNTILLHDSGDRVRVNAFSPEHEPMTDIPVGTVASAYDCEKTGQTFILLWHQFLYFGDRMPVSLINCNQIRAHGHTVQDVPKQYDEKSCHCIKTECGLSIPLKMKGVLSYIPMRRPTEAELDEKNCERIEMTSDHTWDPHSQDFEYDEGQAHQYSVSAAGRPLMDITNTGTSQEQIDRASYFAERREISAIDIATNNNLYSKLRATTNYSDGSSAGDRSIGGVTFCDETKVTYCCERAAGSVIGDCCDRCVGSCFTEPSHRARRVGAMDTRRSRHPVTKEELARKWGIGIEKAWNTLEVTTQKGVRKAIHPVERRFRTAQPHLRKRRLKGPFYSDTCFFSTKSLHQDTCAQVTTDGKGFARFWPMTSKSEANDGLLDFINNDGIPEWMITDGAREQGGGRNTAWRGSLRTYHIKQTYTEPHSPWQNRAEGEIREIKREIRKKTRDKNSPKRLWNYLGDLVVKRRRLTASTVPSMRGRTPHEQVLGWTPDITNYIQFEWYQWIYYLDDGEQKLGKWLVPADTHGGGDAYWVLPRSCRTIVRSTVWAIPEEDMLDPIKKAEREDFERIVMQKLGPSSGTPDDAENYPPNVDFGDIFEEEDPPDEPMEPEAAMEEADNWTADTYDEYLLAEVMLPRNGEQFLGTIKRRAKDEDGNPVGKRDTNPILDTREYEVEFPDGSAETYSTNLIAENLYSQVDEEGQQYQLLSEISDHRSDATAISIDDGFYTDRGGNKKPKQTTRGWELLVSWKDGTASWVKLKDLKESFPVQLAEYAVGNKISSEPGFAWWVPHTLRKKDRIISKVKSKYWKRTHKYGIRLPKSVDEALKFDKEDGTTIWRDAVEKEMGNVRVAFEFNDEDKIPIAHKELNVHWVFDIKMDSLQRKARLVANGNETDPPKAMTFSSVVSRDSVRLFFTIAALNDLEVLSADIQNAYLSAPVHPDEKYWIRAGTEFGSDKGRPAKIVRALYGLKSSGARFRAHLASTIRALGFKSCKADPDVWMRPAVKADGSKYYEYVLAYVDDLLVMSSNPKVVMDAIARTYTLKAGSVKEPDLYLGANIKKWYIEGSEDPGKARWSMSSSNYTKKAITEVERELTAAGKKLQTKTTTPLSTGYRPEIDATAELDADRQNYYQGLIGILRWICELGRLDILTPISMLSRYLVQAREGHLEQCFHVFAYLKSHDRSTMVFDDTEPDFDGSAFRKCDWSEFYPDAKEAIPTDVPEARGKSVVMSCFVDADHAGCRVTRRSHTGVIIFVNRAPIMWFSKRQNTVESSTFGSEFVAMKTAIEMVEGLRYKLRMMGVGIEGETNVFCDNESVVKNSSNPESTLKKRHNAIAYHRVREAIAAGTVRVAKEPGETNLADVLTKLMPGPRLKSLISRILW